MEPKYKTGETARCKFKDREIFGIILLIRPTSHNKYSFEYFINPSPGAEEDYEWYWIDGQQCPIAGHWITQQDIKEIM